MICPRCGSEISDNVNRCSHCGLKVSIRCPECKTVNTFGVKYCKNCGFDFLISCPVCGSTNIYLAKECRKCHSAITPQKRKKQKRTDSVNKVKGHNDIEVVNAFSADQELYNPVHKHAFDDAVFPEKEEINVPKTSEKGMPFVEDTKEQKQSKEQIFQVKEKADKKDFATAQNDDLVEIDEVREEEPVKNEDETSETTEYKQEEIKDETISNEQEPTQAISDEKALEQVFDEEELLIPNSNDDVLEEFNEEIPEHHDFEDREEIPITIQPEAVEKTLHLLTTSLNKHIIAINGPEGSGKTAILNQVCSAIENKGFVSLYGSCTPLVQITSFGFFQDAFLRMMGFPPYTNSIESFTKEFKKSNFSKVFSSMNTSESNLFINMLYPSQKDAFENILTNKKRMFAVLEKALKSFLTDNNLIIIIDNFELLDGASYDFINHILKKGFFNNRLKLLVAYQENKAIQSYFDLLADEEKLFETIILKPLEKDELIDIVSHSFMFNIKEVLDSDYLDSLIEKSENNAIRLEQEIALLINSGYIQIENNEISVNREKSPEIQPASFAELMKLRLNALTPAAKNILYMAAIMGYRFATGVLCQAASIPPDKAVNLLGYLIQEMFITQVDNYTCEFKNLTLWKLIYKEAKNDLLYKENSERLYNTLKQLILSSNLQKVISCTEALSKNESFVIWQNTANITAKLGDTNLYVIAQKQCLKILEEQDNNDSEDIKAQIYEEIGKLLCEKSPKEAVTYLANVLDSEIKDNNIRKIIDLSGYFVKSCYLSGNYFGVTEAVDNIIKKLEDSATVSSIDVALVKTRKLRALLNIGNSEQLINIANEEIIPVLERGLEIEQKDNQYRNLIINAWLLTKIVLAKAYGIQGNSAINNVILDLRNFIEKYRNNSDYYLVQTEIIDAFSKTVSGEINKSNEILNKISSEYKDRKMETNLLAEWNIINIINRVLSDKSNDLKIDLFELAAFTNNINEHFIKNIVKLILGYVIKEEGDAAKALEIYNEEITYFAKEKVAIGALLSWALISEIYRETGDEDKAMNTAAKALDIAKGPKINNYFFIIYFKKILAELYMQRGDLEAAKMYLEEAIIIARKFGLKYQLTELYIAYATYTEEVMKAKRIYSSENVKTAYDLYTKAVQSAKELRLGNLSDRAYKARAGFKTFCQLNSIEL